MSCGLHDVVSFEGLGRPAVLVASSVFRDVAAAEAQSLGQPAILASREGKPYAVLLLETRNGRVQVVYSVVNPDKLAHIFRISELVRAESKAQLPVILIADGVPLCNVITKQSH